MRERAGVRHKRIELTQHLRREPDASQALAVEEGTELHAICDDAFSDAWRYAWKRIDLRCRRDVEIELSIHISTTLLQRK